MSPKTFELALRDALSALSPSLPTAKLVERKPESKPSPFARSAVTEPAQAPTPVVEVINKSDGPYRYTVTPHRDPISGLILTITVEPVARINPETLPLL